MIPKTGKFYIIIYDDKYKAGSFTECFFILKKLDMTSDSKYLQVLQG